MYWSGGANGTWTQVRCYQFLSPSGINDTLCGLSTQYGCTMLDSGASPPRLVMVGYGGELYVYEVGDTNYDPCNCSYFTESGPTFDPDCDENEPSFVQKDNLVDAENPLLLRPPLLAAARVSSTEAVVVGDFGRVTRFDDEGSPDQISEAGTPYTCRLFDGEFLDESVGCVAGQGQLIYKTTDAGINWAVVSYDWTEANSNSIRGIDFSTDGAFGVAVGSGGFIARTTEDSQDPAPEDVVAAWTDDVTKPQHFGPELTAVAFVPSSARVFAVSSGGNVYRSNDNGASWALAAAASVYALHGVDFTDNSTGYVVGDNATVLKTTNGGTSWSAVMVGDANGEAFRDIETWGDGTPAILVADNGGVYVKTSTAFEKLDENDFGFDAPPNHFFDVEVLDSGDTIRIGGDGGIALFFDDGAGWSQPRTSVGISLSKMAFQSADHGFAVGLSFLIAEYTD